VDGAEVWAERAVAGRGEEVPMVAGEWAAAVAQAKEMMVEGAPVGVAA